MRPDDAPHGRRALHTLGVALLVCLGVAGVYATTLGGTFVWDDRELIVRAPSIRELEPIAEYFRRPFWQESNITHRPAIYYRPLVTLSYALDYHLHGPNPAGFHLTNVAWHVVVCAIVFAFARTRASLGAAAVVAAVFGVLPRLSECVAWVAGRTDPMATAFALAAVLSWTSGRRGARALALLLLACGLACKEVALAGAAACVAFEAREAWPQSDRWRRMARSLLPLLALVVAYLVVLRGVIGAAPVYREALMGPGARVRTALAAVASYAWLVVDPFQPRTQIGLVTSASLAAAAAGAAVVVATAIGWARLATREGAKGANGANGAKGAKGAQGAEPRGVTSTGESQTFALVTMALVAIAPVLHLVPLPYSILASDRFLYMPLAAALVAAAPSVDRALRRAPAVTGGLAALLIAALAARTYDRCLVWNDEVRFWADAVRTAPEGDTLPLVELGNVYYRAKMYDDAARAYQKTLLLDAPVAPGGSPMGGPDVDALELGNTLSNVANALAAAGRYPEAAARWAQVLDLQPAVPRNWYDRALLDLHMLDFDSCRTDAARALALAGDYPEARDLVDRSARLEGDAAHLFGPEASRLPPLPLAIERAHFFEHVGRMQDAATVWMQVIRFPDATPLDVETGSLHLVANGPIELAAQAIDRWRSLRPDSPAFDDAVRGLDEWRATVDRLTAVRALTE